ncbi:MAG: FAD/NAD(P)-binding protein [Flavobacteriaceae bacterium]|nr:FAD/NAD(P)-binding protein [Flavobacteriaceae bacterium]
MSININNSITSADLTFIGSGISTSFTLLPLLDELKNKSKSKEALTIAIVEENEELFTGLAYGKRSGSTALLITSLADFLPVGNERDSFIKWLSKNKKALLEDFEKQGGDLSENWINTHKEEIATNKWEDIYIPRRFFGVYIKEKVENAISEYQKTNQLVINHIKDEAIAIDKTNGVYNIKFKNNEQPLLSKRVVLSIGIPPKRNLWTDKEVNQFENSCCLINNPYSLSLPDNLDKIEKLISNKPTLSNVLIIGANASAMEMIYKLNDRQKIKSKLGNINVISPQGELPNSAQDEFTRNTTFIPENLLKLKTKESLKALEIYEAANKDLDEADKLNYGAAITEVPISNGFTSLLSKLSSDELIQFACHYGNEIGKRQRRAGKHYTDVVDKLKSKNKLKNIKGYYNNSIIQENIGGLKFTYSKSRDSEPIEFPETIHVVFNCTGGKTLNQKEISPLLDQLLESKLCVANESNRGVLIDEKMQASPNLYIAGPLLAGNMVNSTALWHIEHCGRIIYLGGLLAKSISKTIT